MQAVDNQQQTIHKIINLLYSSQPIDNSIIEEMQFRGSMQISCYFGLLNIIYKIVCQLDRNAQQEQTTQMRVHRILQGRGQILRQLVKVSNKFLPNPAFYLASFQFDNFNNYCIQRGLDYLFRHSRGIYPLIDTAKAHTLQFLPFYKESIRNSPMLVGNENWMTARKVLEAFYDKQIKSEKLFRSQQSANGEQKLDLSQTEDCEKILKHGIRLCYILLGCKKEEFAQYINMLNKFYSSGTVVDFSMIKQRLRKFALWGQNYFQFIEEGLNLYQGNLQPNTKIFYGCTEGSIEEILISLTQQVFQLEGEQVQIQNIKVEEIRKSLNKLLGYSDSANDFQNLFLCYLHVIGEKLGLGPQLGAKQIYLKTDYLGEKEEPYNRIMFSDAEILELYRSGKKQKLPSLIFGSELRYKILKQLCTKDEKNIAQNLQQLSILNKGERLKFLMSNKLLQQFKQQSFENDGQKIINYLQKNLSKFCQSSGQVRMNNSSQILKNCLQEWKKFYSYMRQFKVEKLFNLMDIFGKSNKTKANSVLIEEGNKITEVKLQYPLDSPNVVSKILNTLIRKAQQQAEQYLNDIEDSNGKQNIGKQNLASLITIFKDSQLHQMILYAQSSTNDQANKQLQNCLWKTYSKIILLLPQQCSLLLNKAQAYTQKPNQPLRTGPMPSFRTAQQYQYQMVEESQEEDQMYDEADDVISD